MAVSRKIVPTCELNDIILNMSNKIYGESQTKLLNEMSNLFRQIVFKEFISFSSKDELEICNRIVTSKLQKTFLTEVTSYGIYTTNYYERITLEFSPPLYFTNTFIEVLSSEKIRDLEFKTNTVETSKLKECVGEYQALTKEIKEFKKLTYVVLSNLKTYDKILKEFPEIDNYTSINFKLAIDDKEKKSKISTIREKLNGN